MKTLKVFALLTITGFITMSMGFPVDITNGKTKHDKKPAAKVSETSVNKVIEAVPGNVPVQQLSMLMFSNTSTITVKVFDVKGTLVMKEDVSMDEFLSKSKKATLPGGSTFVMFHQNTAYYFMETGLVN